MLRYIKEQGEATSDAIAAAAGITPSGARQHLGALERDGLLGHAERRDGPGRPRYLFTLTAAGDALFPRAYAELTNELLSYVEDADPALLARIFDQRAQRRLTMTQARIVGLSFDAQVHTVTEILDEDGYLAAVEQRDDGSYVITEHNCAVLSVALRYGHACGSELDYLKAALPEADVTRIAHRINGGHVCAYEVRAARQS